MKRKLVALTPVVVVAVVAQRHQLTLRTLRLPHQTPAEVAATQQLALQLQPPMPPSLLSSMADMPIVPEPRSPSYSIVSISTDAGTVPTPQSGGDDDRGSAPASTFADGDSLAVKCSPEHSSGDLLGEEDDDDAATQAAVS